MSSILLGTGASEAIPCGFCDCAVCHRARELQGKDVRTRSDFLIDETSMIDYSPDLFYQLLQSGVTLSKLRTIFITHFHEDHVNVAEMGCRNSAMPSLEGRVAVYGSSAALEQIDQLFQRYKDHTRPNAHNYFEKYDLRPLESFKEYAIDGMRVTPLLSSHYGYGVDEVGYNYLITDRTGITFLYAVDTGWYWEETWAFLKKARRPVDYVVMECTYGDYSLPKHQEGHLNLANCLDMAQALADAGMVTRETPIYLSHICHLHSLSHAQTAEQLAACEWNIQAGFDGMKISIAKKM